MKVAVLDVGQGLSVVVQTATHVLVYDTGPTFGLERDAGNRIILPFLQGEGVRKIDGMVISMMMRIMAAVRKRFCSLSLWSGLQVRLLCQRRR